MTRVTLINTILNGTMTDVRNLGNQAKERGIDELRAFSEMISDEAGNYQFSPLLNLTSPQKRRLSCFVTGTFDDSAIKQLINEGDQGRKRRNRQSRQKREKQLA